MPLNSNNVSSTDSDSSIITYELGVGTPATAGINKTPALIAVQAGKIQKAYINAKTAPTGTALICDINKNGVTIFTNQANRIQLPAGTTYATQTAIDVTDFVEGDLFTIDIDQVGSIIAGQDITVELKIKPS